MAVKGGQLALANEPQSSPRPSIRVLIDARKLGHGGIGVYADNLISGLCARPDMKVSVITAPGVWRQYLWHSSAEVIEDSARPYSFDELWRMPARIGLRRFDVFHTPHYILPFRLGCPSIITVHDLIHVYHPEHEYYPWVAGALLRSAFARARRIVTVSQSTRLDIARFSGQDPKVIGKIRVIPNAIDPFYLTGPIVADYLWNRFHLRGRYFLSVVSLLKPHKGVADLISAFGSVVKSMSSIFDPRGSEEPIKLILVGQGAEKIASNPELARHAATTPAVHVLGSVSQQDLLHLYSGAMAVAVPSHAEGFCLPVIEAHALGARVVARPVPAVLELMTESDVVCQDFSVGALAEGLRKVLEIEQEGRPRILEHRDLDSMGRYDRDSLASSIEEMYREALKEG